MIFVCFIVDGVVAYVNVCNIFVRGTVCHLC